MPDQRAIRELRRGVPLDGQRTLPARVVVSATRRDERESTLLLTIREGRNRQVRRMCEAVGHPVTKLKRTSIGPISDKRLKPGEWRELSAREVEELKAMGSGKANRSR